jgi:hypothetical protein
VKAVVANGESAENVRALVVGREARKASVADPRLAVVADPGVPASLVRTVVRERELALDRRVRGVRNEAFFTEGRHS